MGGGLSLIAGVGPLLQVCDGVCWSASTGAIEKCQPLEIRQAAGPVSQTRDLTQKKKRAEKTEIV
jgi:hypothetical protein